VEVIDGSGWGKRKLGKEAENVLVGKRMPTPRIPGNAGLTRLPAGRAAVTAHRREGRIWV
jgi:hypothetical protein